jgi:16S rRNA (guanine527-N7)-methyltransferase
VPAAAAAVFGTELERAERYAGLLVGPGVERGLLGPRETGRIWSRHLLNCAVVAELFAEQARVVDVGSGAGLPGLAVAIARPDLRVDLVEPLQRRAEFLTEAVEVLELGARVRVVRGRAEEPVTLRAVGGADWVTARAVAPLDRLVRWCLPLAAPGGRLALIKGSSAGEEVRQHRSALRRLGADRAELVSCGVDVVDPAVTVVTVEISGTSKGSR